MFSAFREPLQEWLQKHPDAVYPPDRLNDVLHDVCNECFDVVSQLV